MFELRPSSAQQRYLRACVCTILVSAGTAAYAAKPGGGGGGGASCTISTVPNPAVITVGQSVNFTGSVSGKPPATYAWVIDNGGTNPVTSNASSLSVTYNSTQGSPFLATLNGTNDSGSPCSASVSVTVNAAAGNTAPVAQPDAFAVVEDAVLTGNVLSDNGSGADFDPDGDNISVTGFDAVSTLGATVAISANGALSYDPGASPTLRALNDGESLVDTFTYTISDDNASPLDDTATVSVTVDGVSGGVGGGVSINSTSVNDLGGPLASPVPVVDLVNLGSHALLVANDLGMHCADIDYQIFSILPPFNVLHAQVVQRGDATSLPQLVDNTTVDVTYSASFSNNDPALGNKTAAERGEGVFKSNFWDTLPGDANPLWYEVYSPLYFGLLQTTDLIPDQGLPVPDSMKLAGNGIEPSCLTTADPRAECLLVQAWMPGNLDPYVVNDRQSFDRFDHEFNFFNGLLGGLGLGTVVPETNWFAAEGIPALPVDDEGRSNAYPLMRVQAIDKGTQQVLASTDVVLPVASEADCQACHARALDCAAITSQVYGYTLACDEEALDRTDLSALGGVMTLDGDSNGNLPPGETLEQRLLNTAKINILRTHDAKHGTSLDTQRRIVCASCHYSPALDLAQLGPTDSPATEQTQHISMSRAMHGHHGDLVSKVNPTAELFPNMPAPNDPIRLDPVANHLNLYPLAQGSNLTVEEYVLQQSCYSCHPGKRTDCLRGAMASAGIVCQDCHGDMLAVGNDFSHDFPNNAGNIDPSKRVPWAVEPACQSCHVGDAVNQPTDKSGFIYAADQIRLLRAYRSGDADATPIRSADSIFAENQVVNDQGHTVNLLYRLSKGHGGVMCEGCHGSTHAIWPNGNPNANDNVAATQIQGHAGVISECTVCHEPTDDGLPLGNNGPHGMHPIADADPVAPAKADLRWNLQHKNYRNTGPGCYSCHGDDLRGTVLSRAADDRTVQCKDSQGSLPECSAGQQFAVIPKGTEVGCGLCHRQKR